MSFMQPQITDQSVEFENESGQIVTSDASYHWRLSAPGYLDCTDWTPADSIPEAVADCLSMFGDSFDESDLNELSSYLDGFTAFMEGYILALAFTANDESNEDGNPEPLYSNPGGCISEVVDTSEVWQSIPEESRVDLLSDCLSFFVDALPYIGDADCEQAGTDFHFTRNGHGAGFWDGDWEDATGEKLTELSKPYGSAELCEVNGERYICN